MLSQNSLVREYNIAAERSAENSRFAFARAAIESEYRGECDITITVQKLNPETKLIYTSEEVVLQNQPCRLSFEALSAAESSETAARVSQRAKLFISPEIKIPSGSKITVRQDNLEREYALSGIPAVYPTHQEVMLRLAGEYSGEGDE